MNFDIVAENKIKEAMDAGLFDNLAGEGKPLRLEDNPHTPAAWRLAHQIIKDNGFTLPWISARHELEELIEKAYKRLAEAYAETHRTRPPDIWSQSAWRQARESYSALAFKLNKQVRDYNLQAPSLMFQRALIDPEKEIERAEREATTGAMWKAAGG
jgi:hypothetical protein